MKILLLILLQATSVVLQCYITPEATIRECDYTSLTDPAQITMSKSSRSTRINIYNSNIPIFNTNTPEMEAVWINSSIRELHINGSHVKELHNVNVQNISFPFNEVTEIKPKMFGYRLAQVNASYNNINKINFTGFYRHITNVDLSHNLLTILKAKSFYSVKGSVVINVNFNHIHTIENDLFDPYTPYKTLTLRGNKLENISRVFEPYTPLRNIDLSLNGFKVLRDDIFIGLFTVTQLDLSENRIQLLEKTCFKPLLALINLNLSKNQLSSFNGAFAYCHKLQILDISNNKIENLDQIFFKDDNSLIFLDLSHNAIQNLSREPFMQLRHLKTLILKHNKIEKLDMCFGGLRSLKKLDLSHNYIAQYDLASFVGLKSLEVLDISANNIANLNNDAFMNTPKLRRLDVSNNNISYLVLDDIHKCTNIDSVNIDNNPTDCTELRSFLEIYREIGINIDYGNEIHEYNIYGIKCQK